MQESPTRTIRKFNPGMLQSDREVIDHFVVRDLELGIVLEVLRGNVNSQSCQHILVVAPRGLGKTMLLARVAAELRTDSQLSKQLLPVRAMEEIHEISDLSDLWLETLFQLAREVSACDPVLGRELRATHGSLCARWREQTLEEHARAAVLAAADQLNRKLVLMVENFRVLCESQGEDFGWRLRQVLQTEPKVTLLATATSRFTGLDDAQQPFFEFFRTLELRPLTSGECGRLWRAASGDHMNEREIRPLEILTGGSPRLIVMMAGFARHWSLSLLMEELAALIDEYNEYFRSHIEVLPKTERRVYLAVVDLWKPSKPAEIAARARRGIRLVSATLGRLVARGAVIAEGSRRKRLYSAAESLYCIYYKLRRERDEATVVRNLIQFMSAFYGEAETAGSFKTLIAEVPRSKAIHDGTERAVSETPEIRAEVARAMVRKGSMYARSGGPEAAVSVYDEVVERFGGIDGPEVQVQVAEALILKGQQLERLGDFDGSRAVFDQVVDRFADSDEPDLLVKVAKVLTNESISDAVLRSAQVSVARFDQVVERYCEGRYAGNHSATLVSLLYEARFYRALGNAEREIDVLEKIVERLGATDVPRDQTMAATALVEKGQLLARLGRHETALEACEESDRRLDAMTSKGPIRLRWHTARTRIRALLAQGRLPAGLDAFRSAYALFNLRDTMMIDGITDCVRELVGCGVAEHAIEETLAGDRKKSGVLVPLVTALRLRMSEEVRAPKEVLEVAADVCEYLEGRGTDPDSR